MATHHLTIPAPTPDDTIIDVPAPALVVPAGVTLVAEGMPQKGDLAWNPQTAAWKPVSPDLYYAVSDYVAVARLVPVPAGDAPLLIGASEYLQGQWIPVAVALPNTPRVVLVTDGEGQHTGCYASMDARDWSCVWVGADTEEEFDFVVSHWRELPELPEMD